jgi:hypothetical protein
MDKAQQLSAALGRLGERESLALARAVELARVRRKEELPTDMVLAALRPRLQAAKAARIPNLRRLIVGLIAPFLSDREHEPRIPGIIARASIVAWWRALERIAGPEIIMLEDRLAALVMADQLDATEDLAREAQEQAAGWTKYLGAELAKPKADAALRKLFPRPGVITDVGAIAKILGMADLLGAAFAGIDRILRASARLDGQGIAEFTPEAVTAAKNHYRAISEAHGMDACYLPLALLNRLRQPSHILRLGRALSWKPNDSLLKDTEFGVIGERLILDLQTASSDIVAMIGGRGQMPDIARLAAAITAYMDEAEGLLGEFGFRRDSAWGEAILNTRVALSDAIGRDLPQRIGQQSVLGKILPVQRRSGGSRGLSAEPELVVPSAEAVEEANAAARFLILLAQRGTRHGFGQSAREAIDELGTEIESRAATLIDAAREAPGDPAIEAQMIAAVAVLGMLFDDGRANILSRRLRIAATA